MHEEQPELFLILTDLDDPSRQFKAILKDKMVIGKAMNADLVITGDTALARKNSFIRYDNNIAYITDLGSVNHTRCNGRILEQEEYVKLESGMTIGVGRYEYRVTIEPGNMVEEENK